MTTLAKAKVRAYEGMGPNELPVIAADIIYQGAAVGDNGSGYARPLVAGDPFRGFAKDDVDNSAGSAGDKTVELVTKGRVQLAVSGLAITDVGKDVYASDDDTFVLTKSTNTRIGFVHRYVSSGVGIVEFEQNDGVEAELTDNSGGTASDTLAAISGTYSQAEVRNSIATLAAKINYLLRKMGQ